VRQRISFLNTADASWFVYIVECSDGTLYTGVTTDLQKRLDAHNNGTGAKYTRSRRPVKLVWAVEAGFKKSAMMLEYHLKQYSRQQKLELIKED
jgi:putative endonuclease